MIVWCILSDVRAFFSSAVRAAYQTWLFCLYLPTSGTNTQETFYHEQCLSTAVYTVSSLFFWPLTPPTLAVSVQEFSLSTESLLSFSAIPSNLFPWSELNLFRWDPSFWRFSLEPPGPFGCAYISSEWGWGCVHRPSPPSHNPSGLS